MVLVLAALYSIYMARDTSDTNTDGQEQQRDQTQGNHTEGEGDSQSETPSGRTRQQLTEHLKRTGSALYNSAVLRCAPTATSASTMVVGDETDTDDASSRGGLSLLARLQRSTSPKSTTSTSTSSSLSPLPSIEPPPDSVKQEWINACFGSNFLLPDCPVTGAGIGGTFQTVTHSMVPQTTLGDVDVTAEDVQHNHKVGVTVSRLAVGVYVQSIRPGSEAALVGIRPGSILVALNDLPVLAEPSKQLLERLWQYEGFFADASSPVEHDDDILVPKNPLPPLPAPASKESDGTIREPVVLTLIRSGVVYTVVMLSDPTWGIQWAPAAHALPLVKRVYGTASEAGLSRGSLVVAVNGRTFRDMDHVQTALHIRDVYAKGHTLCVTTAFAPGTARPSHYEKIQTDRRHAVKDSVVETRGKFDGVEVKFLPLGYAIGSLCASEKSVWHECAPEVERMEDLSEAVATGRIVAPMPNRRRRIAPLLQKYASCPSPRSEQLWDAWDPLQSLVYCLRFQRCFMDGTDFSQCVSQASRQGHSKSSIELLFELMAALNGADTVSAFLLQFISLICAPGQCGDGTSANEASSQRNAKELTSMLLKLSRKDEAFCQRLYFLLRSYISMFETSRPPRDGDARNLVALLNCLELLRFAEKELGGRSSANRSISASSPSSKMHRKSVSTNQESLESMEVSAICGIGPSPAPSLTPVTPESPPRSGGSGDCTFGPKMKGVLHFLKKSPARTKSAPQMSPTRREPPTRGEARQPITDVVNHSMDLSTVSLEQSPSTMYENMSDFLTELDKICTSIERTFQKSFRQKIADWAMQPWSAGKDATLTALTSDMRNSLESASLRQMLLVNPVESSELLSSLDYNECYILPSAHFPILLTFNVSERRCSDSIVGEERLYRTKVELLSLKSSLPSTHHSFLVHGSVTGSVDASGESSSLSETSLNHYWNDKNSIALETRSSWGAPQTLSLRISGTSNSGDAWSEVGFCWLDLSEQWKRGEMSPYQYTKRFVADVWPINSSASRFDDHGELPDNPTNRAGSMRLEVQVTTECIEVDDERDNGQPTAQSRKRMLLYKHDDDLRQEAFAVQFIRTCSDILKTAGLDMKLLTFQCIPVGIKRGFVEWVPGSVTLSEICDPFGSILPSKSPADGRESPQHSNKQGFSKYGSLRRLSGQQNESLRLLATGRMAGVRGSIANDPIQDYLRSVAFDPTAPYFIRRDVMDTYVKSCAGYSVITYILGVGDRHLDNLLLHQSGSFFHCDFSFILGSDPKTYLPMRLTEDMIYGMGGRESDNFARFLSLISASFLALRRPENVRILLSMVRLMKASCLPDVSENQSIEQAILGVRDRLRLDLSESRAISFMEELVEASLSNKMWIAVDAIHQLGKKF